MRDQRTDDDQINAMFTWVQEGQKAAYTRMASRRKLATDGFALLANRLVAERVVAQAGNNRVSPAERVREGATKSST